jgi:FMN phosphatase YigB (HAD superfamily)
MPVGSAGVQWVVLDLGETLVDETSNWTRWASYLEFPTLTFFAAIGAAIANRQHHHAAFDYLRPGFSFAAEVARRDAAGLGWRLDHADLYDDALPALRALRAAGYRLAAMANQPVGVDSFMATLPIDRFATSDGWGVAKPDPAFFARIITELDVAAENIAYVGDRLDNDIVPAKAAGMTAIHIRRGPWGFIQSGWPEAGTADARIDGLLELPAVLHSLGSYEA